MFRKKRTKINGVTLPEEFSGANIINNVAITEDGTKYAYVSRSGDLMTGEMPEDGKLNVDGTEIHFKKGSGMSSVNIGGRGRSVNIGGGVKVNYPEGSDRARSVNIGGGFQFDGVSGSIIVSGGNSNISIGGSNLAYEINEGYDSVNKVTLKENSHIVRLGLSSDDKVYVKGSTNAKPEYKSGRLFVDGLEGKVSLPKTNPNLELDIKTTSGDIDGDVAHPGRIRATSGDISLRLHAPLTVEVSTSSGDIDVTKMISEGRGIFSPPNVKPTGTLYVEASSGDVEVSYVL